MLIDPVLLILLPLFGSVLLVLYGLCSPKSVKIPALIFAGAHLLAAVLVLIGIIEHGDWQYVFGGWVAPYGIEHKLNAYSAALVALISLANFYAIFTSQLADTVNLSYHGVFYCLLGLCVLGLVGLVTSADVFNIYVFLEISSLTSYALIALAGGKALIASFQYLMLGSMGACFYLLGVGYLYIKTGTLNIEDLANRLEPITTSSSIGIAFILILIGMLLKMGVMPLHTWLPNSYSYSLPAVSKFLAPVATKVAAFVLLKVAWQVYGLDTLWAMSWTYWFSVFIALGIILAALQVLSQRRLISVFAYLIVVEMGYVVAGLLSGHILGFYAAAFHILADVLMMLVLYVAVAPVRVAKLVSYEDLGQLYRIMPLRVLSVIITLLAVLGVPLTVGFVSKWYFLNACIAAQQWPFFIALIFSSVVTLIVLVRCIESIWYKSAANEEIETLNHYVLNHMQQFSLVLLVALLIACGIYGQQIMQVLVIGVHTL